MNKEALQQLEEQCTGTIREWIKDNWYQPLDISEGNFIEHCRMYGSEDIQHIYEEVWDGAPEDDPEVQQALLRLERKLSEIQTQFVQKKSIAIMKAQLTDNLNGVSVPVTATTDNSACSYGQAVWADAEGRAYCQVSLPTPPIFTITDVVADLSERDLLGQYIHGLRLTCGKSIRELAEECGLSPATITDIEYGEFSPQADILQRLFAALGASVTIKQ